MATAEGKGRSRARARAGAPSPAALLTYLNMRDEDVRAEYERKVRERDASAEKLARLQSQVETERGTLEGLNVVVGILSLRYEALAPGALDAGGAGPASQAV